MEHEFASTAVDLVYLPAFESLTGDQAWEIYKYCDWYVDGPEENILVPASQLGELAAGCASAANWLAEPVPPGCKMIGDEGFSVKENCGE